MYRSITVLVICVCPSLVAGCSNFMETRAINAFALAIAEKDLDKLKKVSSPEFEQKALRHTQSLEDFKILHLPDGEITVVKVEDVSDDKKKVVAEVGESKRKLLYELVRDPQSGHWVVNDIYMTQRQQGITSKKSVTEQMDLLLSVRDFLAAWSNGDREDVLRMSDTELAAVLGEIPPVYLVKLTQEVVGERALDSKFKPEAQLNDNAAVVRLPRSTGQMILSLTLKDGTWKVQDVAVESRKDKDHILSVRKQAVVISTVCQFLDDYAARNQEHIAELTTKEFFKGSLIYGNWEEVPLPNAVDLARTGRIEIKGNHADFIAPIGKEVIKISLLKQEIEEANATSKYLVDEITLYEEDGSQRKRLSALFTGPAVMQLFAHSLATRDLDMLRQASTIDLNNRIWKRIAADALPYLPLDEISTEQPQIMSTVFQGPITEITVTQGTQALTYVLKDEHGRMLVDDIIMPTTDKPNSFKTNLDFLISICDFALGIQQGDLDRVRRHASTDFNRIVWHQTDDAPTCAMEVVPLLLGEVKSIQVQNNQAVVRLAASGHSMTLLLSMEAQKWVIDDLILVDAQDPDQTLAMKRAMRLELARTARRRGPITDPDDAQAVLPADYEIPANEPSARE
ncbi:MAG: hypothetical protein ACKVT0_21245 [Planctomycetaceae bacterium]